MLLSDKEIVMLLVASTYLLTYIRIHVNIHYHEAKVQYAAEFSIGTWKKCYLVRELQINTFK